MTKSPAGVLQRRQAQDRSLQRRHLEAHLHHLAAHHVEQVPGTVVLDGGAVGRLQLDAPARLDATLREAVHRADVHRRTGVQHDALRVVLVPHGCRAEHPDVGHLARRGPDHRDARRPAGREHPVPSRRRRVADFISDRMNILRRHCGSTLSLRLLEVLRRKQLDFLWPFLPQQ